MTQSVEILAQLLWTQLQVLEAFQNKMFRFVDLQNSVVGGLHYHRWLQESLNILVRKDYLHYDGRVYTVVDASSSCISTAVWEDWQRQKGAWQRDVNLRAWAPLVDATLRALPQILQGQIPATDVIFPDSSLSLVEGIYQGNPVADHFNEVVADTVLAYLQARIDVEGTTQVRILELGAGTGSTTRTVIGRLHPYHHHIREYCFSDISTVFLTLAEKRFGEVRDFLTYRIVDAEQPLAAQGLETGGFDVVIAANVLHATRNIQHSLRNVKSALKTPGLLVLSELTSHSLLQHLTFGLLEGWWRYDDGARRVPGGPALSAKAWRTVLTVEGYSSIAFLPDDPMDLGQQIILAQSDGVIRTVSDSLMHSRIPRIVQPPAERTPDLGSATNHEVSHVRKAAVTDEALREYVQATVLAKVSAALKIDGRLLDLSGSFSDYGLDSIMAIHLVKVLNEALGIGLKTTELFDYSSVERLTEHIVMQYGTAIYNVIASQTSHRSLATLETTSVHALPRLGRVDDSVKRDTEQDGSRARTSVAGTSVGRGPIAIVGMSGRFAKSRNLDELWEHLANGDDLVEDVSRWDLASYYAGSSDNVRSYCHHGSFLDDIDAFDARFFNISGLEATYMDPQQRIFLEEAYHALEDAGYAGTSIQQRLCGVYVGCHTGDYHLLFDDEAPAQSMWGRTSSVIPARIAYYLNLQGPAIAIDTACSSSLVAIHLACQGLWTGETEMAIAGGVFVRTTPEFYLTANRAGMLSPRGRCFAFDERADGFVFGEGAGAVVLKRLEDALAHRDYIHGVIRGTGMNQDGKTNGITAPSVNSQKRLEQEVYDTFQIDPAGIQMVEAHGTGTQLGDPIEYEALTAAFRKFTNEAGYCALGSIKTNLGHTATAAGVAGLIKVLLSLKHRKIPPSLHYQMGNPHINFAGSPFYVNTDLRDWQVNAGEKRRAAISSFGFSGTNAHLVVEEAPKAEGAARTLPVQQRRGAPVETGLEEPKAGYLITLSAQTAKQLHQQVEQLVEHGSRDSGLDCGNISFTLLTGRKHFNHRLACVVQNLDDLVRVLKGWLEQGDSADVRTGEVSEGRHESPALQRYGRRCLETCWTLGGGSEYLKCLDLIAHLYTQGYALDYGALFTVGSPSRIPLPTYPFSRERYWVKNRTQSVKIPAKQRLNDGVAHTANRVVSKRAHEQLNLFHPVWRPQATDEAVVQTRLTSVTTGSTGSTGSVQHLVLLCGGGAATVLREGVEAQFPGGYCGLLQQVGQERIADGFESCAVQAFTEIQRLLRSGFKGALTVQIVVLVREPKDRLLSGLVGLLRTAAYEHPEFTGQLLEIEAKADADSDELARKLRENYPILTDFVRYQGGKRWVMELQAVQTTPALATAPILPKLQQACLHGVDEQAASGVARGVSALNKFSEEAELANVLWRDSGVYLITGGAGALGTIVAKEIALKAQAPALILMGRSKLREDQKTSLQDLTAMGAEVEYHNGDVTDQASVRRLIQAIRDKFGNLHGIIHTAGVLRDNLLLKKTSDEWRDVLAPKVRGVENLDAASHALNVELDLFLLFSSWAAVTGNVGQADYSAANAFMDAYAAYRNSLVASGKRHGQTLSFNWPLWEDGGMKVHQETSKRLERTFGMAPLPTELGLKALHLGLAEALVKGRDQVLVSRVVNSDYYQPVWEQPPFWSGFVDPASPAAGQMDEGTPAASDRPEVAKLSFQNHGDSSLIHVQEVLLHAVSRLLKVTVNDLDLNADLGNYGFDSILFTALANELNDRFKLDLSPAVFFVHTTLNEVAHYLIDNIRGGV